MICSRQSDLVGILACLGLLCVAATMHASEVSLSTCPGFPLSQCPADWSPLPIPDNNANGVTSTLYVPNDAESVITKVTVWFYITHTWQGDLRVVLTSPAGSYIELVNRAGSPTCGSNGFGADNFGYVDGNNILRKFELDDSASAVYTSPPVACNGINNVSGPWQPVTGLNAFKYQSKVGYWKLTVQALASQDTGTLWVWGMTIRTEPLTPPVVDIQSPGDFSCSCAGTSIVGTANEPDGTFNGYTLDWAANSAGPWTLITSGGMPVINGLLGVIPPQLPEGNIYLRLQAANVIALTNTFVMVVKLDSAFPTALFTAPTDGNVVGGNVCMNRVTASDNCFTSAELSYAPQGGNFTSFFFTHDPNEALPPWNTIGRPDGNYTLRVRCTSTCNLSATDEVAVVVDNTPPVAVINSPANCGSLSGVVQITGTVIDAHLASWTLQYVGGAMNAWETLAIGNTQVVNGVLATWDTSSLPACGYTLRLQASDTASVSCLGPNKTEIFRSVGKGTGGNCLGDFNHDGQFNGMDTQGYVSALLAGQSCP